MSLGGEILNCRVGVGNLDIVLPPESMPALRDIGVAYAVQHQDVQKLIDDERARVTAAAGGGGIGGDLCSDDFFNDFKPLASLEARMDALETTYPDLVEKLTIGTSIEGRSIFALRITAPTGPPAKPAVFLNACQHPREWIATTSAM